MQRHQLGVQGKEGKGKTKEPDGFVDYIEIVFLGNGAANENCLAEERDQQHTLETLF